MARGNSKVHFSITMSRENFVWVKSEAATQQASRSQIIDGVIKNYRHDISLLEKIEEMIKRVSGQR